MMLSFCGNVLNVYVIIPVENYIKFHYKVETFHHRYRIFFKSSNFLTYGIADFAVESSGVLVCRCLYLTSVSVFGILPLYTISGLTRPQQCVLAAFMCICESHYKRHR